MRTPNPANVVAETHGGSCAAGSEHRQGRTVTQMATRLPTEPQLITLSSLSYNKELLEERPRNRDRPSSRPLPPPVPPRLTELTPWADLRGGKPPAMACARLLTILRQVLTLKMVSVDAPGSADPPLLDNEIVAIVPQSN